MKEYFRLTRIEARVLQYQLNQKNNIIENNILLNTSRTAYNENTNIIESNKKENLQLKAKKDLKYNEHISDKNNTIDANSRNNYSTNSVSYSKMTS